jgi:hypothetical protein
MFDEVLVLVRNKLNAFLHATIEKSGSAQGSGEYVAFLEGDKMEPLTFPLNKITPILINVEEEKVLRLADRYEGVVRDGRRTEMNPSIRINLQVLFVSRFSNYEQSLKFLSLIVRFFQKNPLFDLDSTSEIEKLRAELVTLPINQQNELWNSLRTTYLPSVLYRFSVLVFRDDETSDYNEVSEVTLREIKDLNFNNTDNNK